MTWETIRSLFEIALLMGLGWKWRQERASTRTAELTVAKMTRADHYGATTDQMDAFDRVAEGWRRVSAEWAQDRERLEIALKEIFGLKERVTQVEQRESECLEREAQRIAEAERTRIDRENMVALMVQHAKEISHQREKIKTLETNQSHDALRDRITEVVRSLPDVPAGGGE